MHERVGEYKNFIWSVLHYIYYNYLFCFFKKHTVDTTLNLIARHFITVAIYLKIINWAIRWKDEYCITLTCCFPHLIIYSLNTFCTTFPVLVALHLYSLICIGCQYFCVVHLLSRKRPEEDSKDKESVLLTDNSSPSSIW